MSQAMWMDVIGGFISFYVISFVILSPLLIYKIFFKKQFEYDDEFFGNCLTSINYKEADKAALVSLLEGYGLEYSDDDDAFVKRWSEENKDELSFNKLFILCRTNLEERCYVVAYKFKVRYCYIASAFFGTDIKLVSDGNNERPPVEVLPSVSINPKGTSFGLDEAGVPKDQRSPSDRFIDSVYMNSEVAKTELALIFDDLDLKAAIVSAFDLGISAIDIQNNQVGIAFRYQKMDPKFWTSVFLDDVFSALETIAKRLPPAHRVEYTTDIKHPMRFNIMFCLLSAVLFLLSAEYAFAGQPLQPEIYWLIPISLVILTLGFTVFNWPNSNVKPSTAVSVVLFTALFSFGLGIALEYWTNRYGVEGEVIELVVASKEKKGSRYYVYFDPPAGSTADLVVEVGRAKYDKLDAKDYGQMSLVSGRFGLSFANDLKIMRKTEP